METWDIVLLIVAGYVATFGLARLMTRRREDLISQFRQEMETGASKSSPEDPDATESHERRAA